MNDIKKNDDKYIKVSKKDKYFEAFYFYDIEQKEVAKLVNIGLAKIIQRDIDGYGFMPHLFIIVGEYKESVSHGKIINQKQIVRHAQLGNWILIESKKGSDENISERVTIIKSSTMAKRYKALMDNIIITLEGIDIQANLFDDAEKNDNK